MQGIVDEDGGYLNLLEIPELGIGLSNVYGGLLDFVQKGKALELLGKIDKALVYFVHFLHEHCLLLVSRLSGLRLRVGRGGLAFGSFLEVE